MMVYYPYRTKEGNYMSIKDQMRKMSVQNRNQAQQKQDAVMVRAGNKVGLSVADVTSRNWKSHID
jgi:hypothetical protein